MWWSVCGRQARSRCGVERSKAPETDLALRGVFSCMSIPLLRPSSHGPGIKHLRPIYLSSEQDAFRETFVVEK